MKRLWQKVLPKRPLPKQGAWLLSCFILLGAWFLFFKADFSTGYFERSPEKAEGYHGPAREALSTWTKQELQEILDAKVLLNSPGGRVDIDFSGRRYCVETTLDPDLQGYVLEQLDRSRSPVVAFVAMDPATGQVLSMADTDNMNGKEGACLSNRFPAASIFKIITASAAIDACNLSGDTTLNYSGMAHTLYKGQLTLRPNRRANNISLKASFAKSVNPVFGKLGKFQLQKGLLEEYSIRFGFNQWIDFELPLDLSRVSVEDDPYNWAEVASGFNRKTLISPLHAAMIVSAIVNGGVLVEPTIVARITDNDTRPVYVGNTKTIKRVVSPETSLEMKDLMKATVERGTCRSAFRGYRRDPVLSRLTIGGKTGSINNGTDDLRYDWFVGFAENEEKGQNLALVVLVVHDELIREHARGIARRAMKYYFSQS